MAILVLLFMWGEVPRVALVPPFSAFSTSVCVLVRHVLVLPKVLCTMHFTEDSKLGGFRAAMRAAVHA